MISVIRKNKNVHFIGIGGSGMSGLAIILHNLGFLVSGSDRADSNVVRELRKMGMKISKKHAAKNVKGTDLVVYSSAIQQSNPEIRAARESHIPVMRRAEMLGEIMRMKFSIAISGTHGKTTTTSMVGSIFKAGGRKPTIIVGGIVRDMNTSAVLGKDQYAVIEADEFDRSFLAMVPSVAVVTTLEADHLDCYKDLQEIKDAFTEFCNKVPFYGCCVMCIDESSVQDIIPGVQKAVITYGLSPQADYTAQNLQFSEYSSTFEVYHHEKKIGVFELNIPGEHNVRNALAAIAVSNELDIPVRKIIKGLKEFSGVHRRFEVKGKKKGITVVDDYAHHPTEITATLKAAKAASHKRIVAVFQPHLYSRTRDFYKEFARSFLFADVMVITDVYPAREEPIAGITGKMIVDEAREIGHRETVYVKNKLALPRKLKQIVKSGDLVITMGAGDIYQYGERYLKSI